MTKSITSFANDSVNAAYWAANAAADAARYTVYIDLSAARAALAAEYAARAKEKENE